MKSIEYRFNKSYSTTVIAAGLLGLFLLLFQFINFRENTLVFTLVVFIGVFLSIVYAAFFHTKTIPLITFKEDRVDIPKKLSQDGLAASIMFRDFRSVKVFTGDISNLERPGYTGVELTFEKVENIKEVVFFQRKYLEEKEYHLLIDYLSLVINAANRE